MKRSTRIIAFMFSVLMLSSAFAGCGKAAPPVATPSASVVESVAPTVEATPEPSVVATPEPAVEELSGTITINTQAGPGANEAWEAAAKGYMDKHPKVNVVVDLKPAEGYGEWIQGMFGTANPTADIVNINMAGPAAAGKSINFLEYANMTSPYSGGMWTDQFNFEMQVKDLARNEWNNISLESVQVLWTYNKDIFAEVGVEPPKTWDEFAAVCDKIQQAGYQPLAMAGDFNSFWAGQMGWLAQIYTDQTTRSLLDVYRAQKGDYNYDPDVDGAFKLDITDPFNDDSYKVNQNIVRAYKSVKDGVYQPDSTGMKTVWTNFAKIFPKYAGGEGFFGTKDATPLFYQGKAAILLDGAWRLAMFKRDMDLLQDGKEIVGGDKVAIEGVKNFKLGTFNMPSMSGEGIEAPARTIEVAVGFLGAVKKDKAHDDLVTDFMMYYSSAEGYGLYMTGGLDAGWTPNGPSLVKGVQLPAQYADLFKDLEFIGNAQKGYGQLIARGIADIQQSLRDWYGYSQELLTGKINVDKWASMNKTNILKYFDDALLGSKINASDLDNPQNAPTGK